MTPLELREKGYQVLVSQLGQVDAIRFLQQVGWGSGDYTQERRDVLAFVLREEFKIYRRLEAGSKLVQGLV